jgi:hypothetical protein
MERRITLAMVDALLAREIELCGLRRDQPIWRFRKARCGARYERILSMILST